MQSSFDYFNTAFKTSELLRGGKKKSLTNNTILNSVLRKGHFRCTFLGVNSLVLKESDTHTNLIFLNNFSIYS